MMKKILYLLPCLVGGAVLTQAQSITPATFNATGGSATLGGNIYDWSIGEMVLVNTASTPNLIVTQGLLQPEKQDAASSIEEHLADLQAITVYPNPTETTFYVESKSPENGQMRCILKDISGKSILTQDRQTLQGQAYRMPFDISAQASGTYILLLQFTPQSSAAAPVQLTYKIEKI